ncbi:MAG: hypothetical protein HQK51_08395 [Oligoflexia bacterium]|nr:hypothetical protein [Oligoflexia bacterium]
MRNLKIKNKILFLSKLTILSTFLVCNLALAYNCPKVLVLDDTNGTIQCKKSDIDPGMWASICQFPYYVVCTENEKCSQICSAYNDPASTPSFLDL